MFSIAATATATESRILQNYSVFDGRYTLYLYTLYISSEIFKNGGIGAYLYRTGTTRLILYAHMVAAVIGYRSLSGSAPQNR